MMKVAIIGSGAAAAAAHMGLMESRDSLEIVVVSAIKTRKEDTSTVEGKKILSSFKVSNDVISPNSRPGVHSNLVGELFGSTSHGGWTEYWGATMLPWHDNVLKDFLDHQLELREAYHKVVDFVPVMAQHDSLSRYFPLYGDNYSSKRQTALSKALTNRRLDKFGFSTGNSRLAIKPESRNIQDGCTHCGLCLQGCPGSNIWSARHYFEKFLTSSPTNLLVEKIEVREKILIHGFDEYGRERSIGGFDRVIVAAGAISSSSILIKSNLVREVRIKDSPMTLVPFFVMGRREKISTERITLAEAFIVNNPNLERSEQIFMQCYDMNSYIVDKISKFKVVFKFLPKRFLSFILKHFSVAMIFQDSINGGEVHVYRDVHGNVFVDESLPRSSAGINTLKANLYKLGRSGIIFMWPFRQLAETAQGFHFGSGKFLDSDNSTVSVSLANGALSNNTRIHLVDSLALPDIPCFPTTYTIMANAYRLSTNIVNEMTREKL